MTDQQRANFARNRPELYAIYVTLPKYPLGVPVRCPTKNLDGTDCDPDDIPGCGSDQVEWSGDVYDCHECGIFLSHNLVA